MNIELPYPDKILWPNGRGHHMKKHRAFQKHKQWARLATLAAGALPDSFPFPIPWSVTFYPKTRHPVDNDNARASLKAYQDGIADALDIDDFLFAAPTIHFAEPIKGGRIVVVIEGAG